MKVSVAIITYNHENYIAQALRSALSQKVNFDYEIVIGEDCSTDNTREIIIDFQKRFPERIRLLPSLNNLGGKKNFVRTLDACKGDYIALLEGDDYWIDEYKLQKQVDFLNSHEEFVISFHNVIKLYDGESRISEKYCTNSRNDTFTLEDILVMNFIPTCSTLYRRGLFGEFPDWFYEIPIGDWPLHILNAQFGKIGYIDEVMGVYRIHRGGFWSQRTPIHRLLVKLKIHSLILRELEINNDELTNAISQNCRNELVSAALTQHNSIQSTVRQVFDVLQIWPDELPINKQEKAQIFSDIYSGLAFMYYKSHNFPNVRYCLYKAIKHNPNLFRNIGMLSIGFESIFGSQITERIRKAGKYFMKNQIFLTYL